MNPAPWYTSRVVIAAVISILSQGAVLFPKLFIALGLTDPSKIGSAVEAGFQSIALISAAYAAIARVRSPVAPLTLTQKAADNASTPESQAATVATHVSIAATKGAQT